MKTVKDKHIVIIGAARSGVGAAVLLKSRDANVFVSDYDKISEPSRKKLKTAGINFEESGHSEKARTGDFAVVSPGVPSSSEIIQYYLNTGKGVYSEIEAASWFARSPIIATTGSNGKTTVTNWLAHTWKKGMKKYSMAGNIGYAFSEKVLENENPGHFILEISSFQLDHIYSFAPHISLLLNITPDHLNRYQNRLELYAAAKFRITENQKQDDFFIFNYEDPLIKKHVDAIKNEESAPLLWAFSNRQEVPQGAFIRNDNIIFKFNNKEETLMPVHEIGLKGQHNVNNGLATALAARAAEIKNDAIRESLQSFEGVEHRLEIVRIVDGVKYINDSKATNINAVWFALDSFRVPLTLIIGGRDKGNNYADLIPQIKEKVHTVIAIGESQDKIEEQLGDLPLDIFKVNSLAEAVRKSAKVARKGEVVLLSPACASFDMFDDYEHRGKVFKEEVNKL